MVRIPQNNSIPQNFSTARLTISNFPPSRSCPPNDPPTPKVPPRWALVESELPWIAKKRKPPGPGFSATRFGDLRKGLSRRDRSRPFPHPQLPVRQSIPAESFPGDDFRFCAVSVGVAVRGRHRPFQSRESPVRSNEMQARRYELQPTREIFSKRRCGFHTRIVPKSLRRSAFSTKNGGKRFPSFENLVFKVIFSIRR